MVISISTSPHGIVPLHMLGPRLYAYIDLLLCRLCSSNDSDAAGCVVEMQ